MQRKNNRNPSRKSGTGNGKHKPCKSEAQKKAIRTSYARKSNTPAKHIPAPFPHFRYYRKSGHPALIVGEQKSTKQTEQGEKQIDEYRYRKVMHGKKDGDRKNETVYPNPDPSDPEPMHIGKRVRHDEKINFDPRPLSWKYPKK